MASYDDDDDDDRDDDDAISERPIKKKSKRRNDPSEGGFLGFLLFRKFVGDWIIIIVFWVLVVLCVLGGLAAIVIGIIAARAWEVAAPLPQSACPSFMDFCSSSSTRSFCEFTPNW